MGTKIRLLIILTIIFKCNGHVPILSDIISGAHNVFDGIAHGFIGGQFELKNKPSPPPPPKEPEKTVIVIVDGESNENDRVPNNARPPFDNGYGHGSYGGRPHQYGTHNQYGYGHHGHQHNANCPNGYERPQSYDNNYYGNEHHGNHGHDPHRDHNYPSHPPNNYNQHNYHSPGHGNGYNKPDNNPYNYNNQPNRGTNNNNNRPNQGNNFNDFTTPNQGFNDYGQNNQGNYDNSQGSNFGNNNNGLKPQNTDQLFNKPTDLSSIGTTVKPTKVTENPKEDRPLFIPLNPNETDSGDDKTNTDPKRETENKDDEEFEIDVRIKNK